MTNDDGKTTICRQPGTPAEKTMTIPTDAWPEHQGHGETIGACDGVSD